MKISIASNGEQTAVYVSGNVDMALQTLFDAIIHVAREQGLDLDKEKVANPATVDDLGV